MLLRLLSLSSGCDILDAGLVGVLGCCAPINGHPNLTMRQSPEKVSRGGFIIVNGRLTFTVTTRRVGLPRDERSGFKTEMRHVDSYSFSAEIQVPTNMKNRDHLSDLG